METKVKSVIDEIRELEVNQSKLFPRRRYSTVANQITRVKKEKDCTFTNEVYDEDNLIVKRTS